MQTIVYQCDTAMPAQKLPNCCSYEIQKNIIGDYGNNFIIHYDCSTV